MKLGYLGLGNMGGALAERLLLTYPLIVSDRSEAAIKRLVGAGATAARGHADFADCDAVFICLPTSVHVREVILGEGGLGAVLKPGSRIIDQTTGDPNVTRAIQKELAKRGVSLIDAPVSGGAAGAKAGTIAIMVGASQPEFDAIAPLLHAISPNVFHAGEVGAGQVMKLVNNLMSTVQRALSFEAVALAAKNGVDSGKAVDILLAGGGKNSYLEKIMRPRVLAGKLNIGFTLGLAHKDVRLACDLGTDTGVPMFLGNAAREIYQMCISEMGRENQVDTIGIVYDRLSGTQVVPDNHDLKSQD